MKLNLFNESGDELPPRRYSYGKDQLDTVTEILGAFGSSDMVALKGMVGSGKSVVGIRTIIELGRGVVAVPTIWLSKQYATDYEEKKHFINGTRVAGVKFLKGRGNFDCPYAKDKADKRTPKGCHANKKNWSAARRNLPCTRPIDERRIFSLKDCKYWGFIFPGDAESNRSSIDNTPELRMGDYDIGSYLGLKNRSWSLCTSKQVCSYWKQFRAYLSTDCVVMNKDKWMCEVYIGRVLGVPITVVDEGDEFLDSLAETIVIREKDIGKVTEWMGSNITNLKKEGRWGEAEAVRKEVELLNARWEAVLHGGDNPIDFVCSLADILERMDTPWAERFYWRVERIKKHKELAVHEIGDKKVTYAIPYPEVILDDIRNRVGGKWLLMSATFQDKRVLREVYNINPVFVEGERKFPGTLVEVKTGMEKPITRKVWNNVPGFREWFAKTRKDMLASMVKPGIEIIHAYGYLSAEEEREIRETQNEMIRRFLDKPSGILSTTKLDRGIDLTGRGIRSILLNKFPYPYREDLGLRAIRERLGDRKWGRFYEDMARRDFLQQVGRVMRSDEDVVEFWSPDEVCHKKLPLIWKGRITKKYE